MNNPTPDKIAAAIELLRRVPGTEGGSTLDEIEAENNPIAPMVHALRRELLVHFRSHGDVPDFGTLSDMLTHLATECGLRITTDPDSQECECGPTVPAPKVITSVEDLGSMPDWSVVVAPTGLVFQAGDMPDGPRWMSPWLPGEDARRYNAASLLREYGSVTVLRIPEGGKA